MKILFVLEYRYNAGNVHAVANYARVAQECGHVVAFYGPHRPDVLGGHSSGDVSAFDRVVFSFESKLYRVKPLQEVSLLSHFPRQHRYILDADGMYNPVMVVDGYDRNYRDESQRTQWLGFYDALAERILKPSLAEPDDPRVTCLPFFGYNPALRLSAREAPPKVFDVLHVGHNWWRWKDVREQLLPAFQRIRSELGEIGFVGLWWDAVPDWAWEAGLEPAFRVETEAFRRLRIRTSPPVAYSEVIRTMSTGRVNIFTQRPFLSQVKHLTLRYIEEFCADTIPLLLIGNDLAEAVYGPAGRELTLPGRVADKILDALRRPEHYRGIVEDVRRHLQVHHSYTRRVEELVRVLGT
jgi:hypothetical protein